MNILITGHKGFIGSNMIDKLRKDHNITTYEWGESFPDISDLDWVIHLGAITSTTETDVEKILRQNLDFSIFLLDECIYKQVNLQYSSTAAIYGLGNEFKETSPVDPRTPYAWSKYLFERHVKSKTNLEIIVQGFRYFNVYGDYGEEHKLQSSPHYKFKQQALQNKKIKIFENSENYFRDFVHVDEIISYHEKFLQVKESGVWNLGTGKMQSFLEIAQLYSLKYDAAIELVPMPAELAQSYQKYTCADMSYTFKTLGLL